MDSDEETRWRNQVEQLIETNRLLMEQLRETAPAGHDSRLSPSRADLSVSQKFWGRELPTSRTSRGSCVPFTSPKGLRTNGTG